MSNKYVIKILPDEDPESPREWDNLGTMVCAHSRYNLGDEQSPTGSGLGDRMNLLYDKCPAQLEKLIERYNGQKDPQYDFLLDIGEEWLARSIEENPDPFQKLYNQHFLELPLYLYDHSGITMKTSPFSCGWDSGQVGFIYISKDKIRGKWEEKIYEYLKSEVKTYDQYLTGDVYGFVIEDQDGDVIDSCWGFYGEEYAREEVQSIVDWHTENELTPQPQQSKG